MKVAYVVSRFPKLTETFIANEIAAVTLLGIDVDIYALLREPGNTFEQEYVRHLAPRVRFTPFISIAILRSHCEFMFRHPRRYVRTLWAIVRETIGSANYLLGALAYFPKAVHIARLIRLSGVQHVHCHFASHPALVGYVIHQLTGVPFSFTAHGSDLHRERRGLCLKVNASAFVVVISDYNRRIVLRECGVLADRKIAIIHSGVDASTFAPRPRRSHGKRRFTIVAVGTLHAVKGYRHLVAACQLLTAAGIDFVCYVVGDGPDRERLRAQAVSAGLRRRVVFLGPRKSGDIAMLLGRADALVVPSVVTKKGRREGIPVVLMEAMSAGVPVVASRLSGIPELVEHERTGLLVVPGDYAELARSLARLASDPDLRGRLGSAGRLKVVADFELHSNAAALAHLFRKPLGSNINSCENLGY